MVLSFLWWEEREREREREEGRKYDPIFHTLHRIKMFCNKRGADFQKVPRQPKPNGKQLYSESRHAYFHGILRWHGDQKVLNKLQGWCVSVWTRYKNKMPWMFKMWAGTGQAVGLGSEAVQVMLRNRLSHRRLNFDTLHPMNRGSLWFTQLLVVIRCIPVMIRDQEGWSQEREREREKKDQATCDQPRNLFA